MNYDAMRKHCVATARKQFAADLRAAEQAVNYKPRLRFVDLPLPLIINSGCCVHNILYTLPCKHCRRKEMQNA